MAHGIAHKVVSDADWPLAVRFATTLREAARMAETLKVYLDGQDGAETLTWMARHFERKAMEAQGLSMSPQLQERLAERDVDHGHSISVCYRCGKLIEDKELRRDADGAARHLNACPA